MTEQHNERTYPPVHKVITRSAILHVEDALEIGKLRLRLYRYRRGEGAQATAFHYLDVDDARVLFFDLGRGRLEEPFVDYKGSPTARDGKPLSRVLKVEDTGDKTRNPIVFEARNGPGELIGQGAVKPAGDPDSQVAVLISRAEARKMAFAVLEYLQAYAVARQLQRLWAPQEPEEPSPGADAEMGEPAAGLAPSPLESPVPSGNGGGDGAGLSRPTAPPTAQPTTATNFWGAVYSAGKGQTDGQRLLAQVAGDFGRALDLLRSS